jgi:hypothetical protein
VQTTKPTTARPESRARRQRLVVAACIAVTLLVALSVKLWLDHRVPSPDADAGRLSRYMASPAFAALPDAQKAPYLDAFQRANDRGELTPEQQRGVSSNVRKDPIQHYFSLTPGKEREKFLDDAIDRVLKTEKEGKLPPPRPDKEGVEETEDRHLADSIPPEDRARMSRFMQDLHDRRVARGLPDDGKFLLNRAQ